MIKKCVRMTVLYLVAAVPAIHANEMADAAESLCEKVKSCALAQMAEQDLSPEMRQMMQPTLDGMCAQVRGKVGDVPTGHPLYKPAVACLDSMNALSCEEMHSSEGALTPACEEYEELARAAGEME